MTATQNYRVDSFLAGLAIKAPCLVATTANITLSGEQTINSVAVVAGNRVLVKDQTDATENGIYVAETSAWNRAGDFDGNRDFVNGTQIPVANAAAVDLYQVSTADPITVDTTSITIAYLATVGSALLQKTSVNAGLTADTGSSQGDGVITHSYSVYSTVANTGDAATLPATFEIGTFVCVKNDGANSMDIFPASGDDAGAGADTAVTLASGSGTLFLATVADTTWTQIY